MYVSRFSNNARFGSLCQLKLVTDLLPNDDVQGIQKLFHRIISLYDDQKSVQIMELLIQAAEDWHKIHLLFNSLKAVLEKDRKEKVN